LFKNELRLYIYPCSRRAPEICDGVQPGRTGQAEKLHGYLVDSRLIKQLENVNRDYLHIFSRDALSRIRAGDPTWEAMVPPAVAAIIKHRRFLLQAAQPPDSDA
jgi:hypothetical protein